MKRLLLSLLSFCVLVLIAGIALAPNIHLLLQRFGLEKEEVLISGTGSMYPTFPKGEGDDDVQRSSEIVAWPKMRRYPTGITLFGRTFFSHTITYGDIVEFDNEKTKEISSEKYSREAGFVKRVVGLPGDTLELRDGFFYRNSQRMDEPYTAKPRSTYGGDYLPDCKKRTIAPGTVFVMGDNRKASMDSRFTLGMINEQDIHYVLPWSDQEEYKKHWRDTTADGSLAHTATLDPIRFISLLNEKRAQKNLKPLVYKSLLSTSARYRGEEMIGSKDITKEATGGGQMLRRAIERSGYRNIVYAELFTRGFYEAEELLENLLTFPDSSHLLYTDEYQDFGVSAVLGDVDQCPVQLVVVHFSGYQPPEYTLQEKESWKKLLHNVEEVLPSWEQLKGSDGIDQQKLNRLLEILHVRKRTAQAVVAKIESVQWLSDDEKRMVEQDKAINDEAQKIVGELSGQ